MRFVGIFLLAIIATVIAEEKRCEPGTVFKQYCNTCHCSPEGKPEGCTKMYCDPEIWNEDGTTNFYAYQTDNNIDRKRREVDVTDSTTCEPGKTFKIYCNTCKCSPEGKPTRCSRMQCDRDIWNEDGTKNVYAYQTDKNSDTTRPEVDDSNSMLCEPGKPFKIYCNTCKCSPEGKPTRCSKMQCDRDVWNKDGTTNFYAYQTDNNSDRKRRAVDLDSITCKPNEPFKLYCNTCMCSSEGKIDGCTRMECDLDVWNKDGTTNFYAYQTDWSSDRKRRAIDLDSITCKPNEPFKLYCNTCMCSSEGKIAGCTRMECDLDVWNKDGTTNFYAYQTDWNNDRKRREIEETKSCEPGKLFKRYCNTCKCSEEGKPKHCTRIRCDLDIWNEDGSIKYSANEVDWDDDALYYRKKRETGKPVICSPGRMQKRYCNTCTCSSDGTEIKCTNMPCAFGEFERNGMRSYQHYDLHL